MVSQKRAFSLLETEAKQSLTMPVSSLRKVPFSNGAGFTVIELIVIVIFLGIFAAIAVPRLNFAIISKTKADAVARKIVTDLRRTRRLAISDAAENTAGFELRMVPPAPYTAYTIGPCLGHHHHHEHWWHQSHPDDVDSHTIDPSVSISCPGVSFFSFGPLGNLKADSGNQLTVAAEGKTFTITIIPATGTVKCIEN